MPGIDFTDITDTAKAYFECVNDNGGINGRPIDYIVAEEHGPTRSRCARWPPNSSSTTRSRSRRKHEPLDCPVNHEYYEKNNFNAIMAGVPNHASAPRTSRRVNMGPLYSSLGAVRYVIDKAGAKGTLVIVSPKQPGNEAVNQGALTYAKQKGLKTISRTETVPISDPGVPRPGDRVAGR